MDRRVALVLALALAAALAGCGVSSLPSPTPTAAAPGDPGVPADGASWTATVTRVVDGDTVAVRYANGSTDTVRLVGVDTPETHGATNPGEFEGVPADKTGRACLADAGERASDALAGWVDGERVRLVHDPGTDRRDRYGRLLAYLVRDGRTVNYRLVDRGHARVYDTSFTRADAFYAAESAAQRAGRGVWACRDPSDATAAAGLDLRVVADAPGNDNENLNGEFAVVERGADRPLSIGNWTLGDAAGHEYVFPATATVPADGAVRVYTGSGTDTATDFYWGADGAVWNNDGDTATLRAANGSVMVQVSY